MDRADIEEGELESENETVSPEPDLMKIFSKQEKKENVNGIKLEDIAAQSETISSQQELATDSEETKAKEFSHVLKPHIYTFNCKYSPFTLKFLVKTR